MLITHIPKAKELKEFNGMVSSIKTVFDKPQYKLKHCHKLIYENSVADETFNISSKSTEKIHSLNKQD